jgi:hypothetical protein
VGAVENGRPFTTGFGDVDAALSDLRGEAPGRFDAELAALARVIEALPADPDRPLQCRMTLRGLAPTDSALPASDRFPELQVLLDGEPAGPFVDMRRPQVELGTVSYPGPGLAFALARVEDGAGRRVHRELVAGPWAPLALLHAFADSARTTDDGTTWEIEVAFTDSTSGEAGPLRFAFRLVLEFDRPLPPPAEWPR